MGFGIRGLRMKIYSLGVHALAKISCLLDGSEPSSAHSDEICLVLLGGQWGNSFIQRIRRVTAGK